MERVPEPELMEDPGQAAAYAAADFRESNGLFVRLFGELAGPDFAGCVLDLGCGPGDIPLRLARAHPRATVDGLDGSAAMLELAEAALDAAPDCAGRVAFARGRLPGARPPRARYDAVVSNSLLHHLARPAVLWDAVARHGSPGAVVLAMDLFRPADTAAADAVVARYAEGAPAILRRDFLASLRAAFTPDEVRAQLAAAGLGGLAVRLPSDRHLAVVGRLPA